MLWRSDQLGGCGEVAGVSSRGRILLRLVDDVEVGIGGGWVTSPKRKTGVGLLT